MGIQETLTNTLHLLYLVSNLVPKSNKIWIFGAWFGQVFADNPKHLFLYATSVGEKKCVWITRSRNLAKLLSKQGYCAYHYLSLIGVYYQMRAGTAFFSHDTDKDLLGPAISHKTRRYQLWHGTPLKTIRYGVKNSVNSRESRLRRFIHLLFPWKSDEGYDFVPAASEASVDQLKEAFHTKNVFVTGYPRNDALIPGDIGDPHQHIKRCIYMPTFRGEFRTSDSLSKTSQFLNKTGFNVEYLDHAFTKIGITMTLRLHPTNLPTEGMIKQIEQSNNISLDKSEDIYEILNEFDLLITDYSSIFFDFVITGKPIIHAPFDLVDYICTNRDLYFDYDEVCLTPHVKSWDDVISIICKFRQEGINSEYIEKYRILARRFNRYIDNCTCRRIYDMACIFNQNK